MRFKVGEAITPCVSPPFRADVRATYFTLFVVSRLTRDNLILFGAPASELRWSPRSPWTRRQTYVMPSTAGIKSWRQNSQKVIFGDSGRLLLLSNLKSWKSLTIIDDWRRLQARSVVLVTHIPAVAVCDVNTCSYVVQLDISGILQFIA